MPEDSALYRDALLDGFGDLGLRALAEPSAVLVLAGAGGVGRSTQLQQILSLVADDTDLIAFRARPKVGFEAVDATLRFHLGQLGSEDASASLLHLFGERLRAGRALLLAIDDAHLLGGSVLEHLFSLRRQLLERLGATARLFLVGDPAFAANPLPGLDAEADAQVLRLHLRAFNREQTHAYLRHRLLTAGHAQPDTLLRRELIDRLHTSSSGLPKYLNALAEDWLEECCDQGASFAAGQGDSFDQAPSAASAPARGEAPADAMVSAMTALEALRNASSQALESSEKESLRAGASSGARPDGAQGAARAGQSSTAKNRARGGKRSGQTKARAKKSQAAPAGETLPVWNRPWFVPGVAVLSLLALLLPLVWQLPGSEGEDPALRLPPRELPVAPRPRQVPVAPGVPLVGPQPSAPAVEQPLRRELDVPAILPGEPVAENTAEAADAGADSALPDAAGNQAGTDSTESSSEDSAERSSAAGTDGAESGSGGLDRDWILQQSGEHFTIQLTAARSVAAARQHVAGFGNLDVRFVPTRSKSQDFVIVLAGAYPARADAERALEKLPAALREQGYWVRSIDSVRQSLRE
ncbi:AAA family ATPase [Thiorhodovibrio frisius]|uniref:AAA family ATPase n=1 Tax=Thiorhodovibrio frisius TaxID=631362 RepID=UPI0002EF2316|nr:AAA family ATPase [Thiorhodovibrio frisius]